MPLFGATSEEEPKSRRAQSELSLTIADQLLFEVLARGEFAISGLRNRDLRAHIPGSTVSQICRRLKRLRLHGVVKQVPGTFKYYLTDFGRRAIVGSLALKEMTIIPAIARASMS